MLKLSKINERRKNEEDENEYVESEDDSDFETEIHFGDNELCKEQVFYVHQLIFYY